MDWAVFILCGCAALLNAHNALFIHPTVMERPFMIHNVLATFFVAFCGAAALSSLRIIVGI